MCWAHRVRSRSQVFDPDHAFGVVPGAVLVVGDGVAEAGDHEPTVFDGMIGPEGEVGLVVEDAGVWAEIGEIGEDSGLGECGGVAGSGARLGGEALDLADVDGGDEDVAIGGVVSEADWAGCAE